MNKFLQSMRCAFKGIRHALFTERNMRVHLLAFMLAVIAGVMLEISKVEFLMILAISAVTFSLELTNTAIERLADRVSLQHDEKIGMVKDIMAGAVFVSAIFAIVIGLIIFYKPVLKLFVH